MGNAGALVQSDDWAALIADAKSRNCYMDMDSLPKDFVLSKGPSYTPLPGKPLPNPRGLRSVGPRHRAMDMHVESRSEDEEKLSAAVISRNGSYRPYKPPFENSLDNNYDHPGDKSRETWQQYGVQKKQNSHGVLAKREN